MTKKYAIIIYGSLIWIIINGKKFNAKEKFQSQGININYKDNLPQCA
jgi:hypothetical protein